MLINLTVEIDNYLKCQQNLKSCSLHTLRAYRIDFNQIISTLPPSPRNSGPLLSEADLKSVITATLQKWSPLSLASRNRKMSLFKNFLKSLYEKELLKNPLHLTLFLPKVPRKIPHFISVDEVLTVLSYLKTEIEKNPNTVQLKKNEILFLLLYGGGLRISEACHLKWSDIQFSLKQIKVLGKGQKERLLPLPQVCFVKLKQLKSIIPNEKYIFGLHPLNTRTGYEIIRKLSRQAQLMKPLNPHALRHSFATHLLSSGANLRILQTLLGHECLVATEKYTHLNLNQLAHTMESTHPLNLKNKVAK